jgi:hypothetical protein
MGSSKRGTGHFKWNEWTNFFNIWKTIKFWKSLSLNHRRILNVPYYRSRYPSPPSHRGGLLSNSVRICGILSGSSLHVILPVSFYQDTTHIHSSTTAAVPSKQLKPSSNNTHFFSFRSLWAVPILFTTQKNGRTSKLSLLLLCTHLLSGCDQLTNLPNTLPNPSINCNPLIHPNDE